MAAAWQAGNTRAAATEAARQAASAPARDALLWRLEQGAILSDSGDAAGGLQAFAAAEEMVNRFEAEAQVRLGSEFLTLLSNQATLPYRGRAYEKVLLNTYKALNQLELGQPEAARVELNRALRRQQDAVHENRRRIEAAQEAAARARAGQLTGPDGQPRTPYDVDRALRDPVFADATQAELARLDARLLPYADYVNPFTVFLDGLFFAHQAVDNTDVERALKSFERVLGMSPGRHVAADYAMVERMANGEPAEIVTYVLFATGSAPVREEVRFDIPLFLVSSTPYIGAAFPRLRFRDRFIPELTARTRDGTARTTELLCSMDAVIARDFRNEWPELVIRTLLTTATKAVAGKALQDSFRDNSAAQALAWMANLTWQLATNQADLRSWTSLPKHFAYLRLPTPEDGALTLHVGSATRELQVAPGRTNVVLVRSVNDHAPPLIRQFTLN